MTDLIGWLFGIESLEAMESVSVQFAAPWATGRPVLVLFAVILVSVLAVVFYYKHQDVSKKWVRLLMAASRAVILSLLVLILAEPVVSLGVVQTPQPLLLMLFDSTDSMNIKDKMAAEDAEKLSRAMGVGAPPAAALAENTRLELVKQMVASQKSGLFAELSERYRIRAYQFDRLDAVTELSAATDEADFDIDAVTSQLKADGQVTALGAALADIGRRHRSHLLAGVVVVSDFDNNAGTPPMPAAERLGVPLYTVGVGAQEVVDLSVDLQAPQVLKKGEQVAVTVHLRQSGLTGRNARVELFYRRLGLGSSMVSSAAPAQTVELKDEQMSVPVTFLPEAEGRYALVAKVEPFEEEVLADNNSAQREISVRDDTLKILFIEQEPTWEWRFIKEVFYRDPLIGEKGFRTFLRSADFKVRRDSELFLETLIRPRAEFFAYDVIFISDVPSEIMPLAFQEMLREYVEDFGGGLVVMAGPRNGLSALRGTAIEEMLPVVIDGARRTQVNNFRLQMTAAASAEGFMNLGKDSYENSQAWEAMGPLPWYQPVARLHPLGTALAQHPVDRCVDNLTQQPLIATRQFGKGEVIYLGFNESWRLRRKYGEQYYRQFWGQMIYRLGLGRALGEQKRFQVYTDRPSYQSGDRVRVTVEGYNRNFEPLSVDSLNARLMLPDTAASDDTLTSNLVIPMSRDQVIFETSFPVYSAGEHRVLVRDPVAGSEVEANFTVAAVTAERRNAVRDVELQTALAAQTGGKHYELHEIAQLSADLQTPEIKEVTERRFPLWNTWLILLLGLFLMLSEWAIRKLVNLR